MQRADWLLLFLAVRPTGAPELLTPGPGSTLDPIRLQKGLFLFQEQAADETKARLEEPPYDFEPYAYGPFTRSIYADLEELHRRGLIQRLSIEGQSYPRWRLTDSGRQRVEELLTTTGEVSAEELDRLRAAKRMVVTKNFAGLLRYVYSRYPDYARESVARL